MWWSNVIRLSAILAVACLASTASTGCRSADAPSRERGDTATVAAASAVKRDARGVWRGMGPCDGRLIIRADGTFERIHYSPGDNHLSGSWTVASDGERHVLSLTCDASDDAGKMGVTTELEIVRLDAAVLEYRAAGQQNRARYKRDPR